MTDFTSYQSLLFSIAYRMLGSAVEAEDMVQETYLRYQQAESGEIHSLKSYLTTIITRLCLDRLKSAQVVREQYVGVWLPEPILTTASSLNKDSLVEQETLSLAFLTLLECLTPPERAVWLLVEAFDYQYDEIAEIIDKSSATCRQLYHRAKERLALGQRRFEVWQPTHARLLENFLLACQQGDIAGLTAVLASDVVCWSDGGGKVRSAIRPVIGQTNVLRLIIGLLNKVVDQPFVTTLVEINGQPALVNYLGGQLFNILALDFTATEITGLRLVTNPDKLHYLAQQLQRQAS